MLTLVLSNKFPLTRCLWFCRSHRLNGLRTHAKGFGKRAGGKAAEDSLKSTIEIDRFIDKLRFASEDEVRGVKSDACR